MKVDYGVRALIHLAQHYGDGPVQASELAASQAIPEPYWDQVLTTLHKFGLIRSRRGPQGGHALAKGPTEIDLNMIMVTLDGTSAPLSCMDEPTECTLFSSCAQREVWHSVEKSVHSVLSSTTIADLVARQLQLTVGGTYQI